MGLTLGQALAGAGYAIRAGVSTYGDIKRQERETNQEKRTQEEADQKKKEWARRNKVDDRKAQQQADDLDVDAAAQKAAREAAAATEDLAPSPRPLSAAMSPVPDSAGDPSAPGDGVTVTPFPAQDQPQASPIGTAQPGDGMPAPLGTADAGSAPSPRTLASSAMTPPSATAPRTLASFANTASSTPAPIGTADVGAAPPAQSAAAPRTLSSFANAASSAPAAPVTLAGQTATPASSLAPGESGGIPDASSAAPKRTFSTAYRQAAARANAYTQAGQPDKATKVLQDYYNNAIAEAEARNKFDLQPRMQKLREAGLTTDELKNSAEYQKLQRDMQQASTTAAGQMWGLLKAGDMQGATRLFNASGLVAPGMEADHMQEMDDGKGNKYVVAVDARGKVLQDKTGRPVAVPVNVLERAWISSNTTTTPLPAHSRLIQTTRDEKGGITTKEVIGATDPAGARKAATEERVASTAENTRRDKLRSQARDAVKNQLFAGQGMFDKVDDKKPKIHARAAELAERYADQGVAPGAAASRAIREIEDAIDREARGAGQQAGTAPPAKGGATVADIIGR